jgi:hypothetical protein
LENIFDSVIYIDQVFFDDWKINNGLNQWHVGAIKEKANGIDNIVKKGPLSHGFR